MVLQALKELNSTPNESIYVGDSEVDVATAENSGLLCIGVTWGFRDAKSLKESGADFLVDSPAQLLDIAQNTECETAL